jgi:hypothetical protein
VTDKCSGTVGGWIHDPELEFKWGRGGWYTPPAVRAAARALRAGGKESGLSQGITSFAAIAGHRTLPWTELAGFGFGSPQLYTVGPTDVDRGIEQWRKAGWERIIPSVPLYGKNSGAHLHDYLSCFVDGSEDIDGLLFWSWRQGSADEWRIIARWAEWLERGMCLVAGVF